MSLSLLDLEDKIKNLFNQGGRAVSNIAQNVGRGAQQVGNYIQQDFNRAPAIQAFNNIKIAAPKIANAAINTRFIPGQVNTIGQIGQNIVKNPNQYNLYSQMAQGNLKTGFKPYDRAGQLAGSFIQNKYVEPLTNAVTGTSQALNPKLSLKDRGAGLLKGGLGGLQTGFNLTPAGAGWNVGYSAFDAAKANDAARLRGQNQGNAAIEALVGNKTVGLGDALTKNKLLATVGNVAEFVGPLAHGKVSNAFKEQAIKQTLKEVSPNAFSIHPEDEKILNNYMDRILNKGEKLQSPELKDLQNLAEHYLGEKFRASTNKRIAQAFEHVLAAKNGGIVPKMPAPYLIEGKKNVTNAERVVNEYAPQKASEFVTPKLEKLRGESTDQAIARNVGYQIDNGVVSLKETSNGWQASVKTPSSEISQILSATKKQDLLNQIYKKFNPDYGVFDTSRVAQQPVGDIASEAIVNKKGNIKISNIPTQTAIKNRAEISVGNPDLYDQRAAKWNAMEGNPEPLPWEVSQPNTNLKIPTDIATQTRAEGQTVLGNQGKGGFGGLDKETQNAYQEWVNSRKATRVEATVKNKEFSHLNDEGIGGFLKFQGGEKGGKFSGVKEYFDTKYDTLQKNGVKFGYRQDYLPQLWANSEQEVAQVFGRSLGTRPSFTREAILKDYEEGISKGLTPRFKTVGELAGWYEQRANKALADKKFFDYLGTNGFLQSSGKAPQGWVTLDPDRFPKVTVNTGEKDYTGVYKAPPELAGLINNYLKEPSGLLNGIANYVSRAKNVTLSFGIPKTGVNAHGFNILARHTLFGTGGNPVTRFLTGAKYMLHPGAAEAELTKTLQTAPQAVKSGLTLSAEEHTALLNEGETVAKSLGKNWNNTFEKPLFNKMIPALKLSSYNELVKNGMDGHDAAKMVNNVYGGINWEQMGRNRDSQNFLRSVILAPDWAESNLRMGGNLLKSFTQGGPVAARYRTMTATLLGSIVAANVANKLSSGHYMYENDPGHTFEIQAGYTGDGTKRYIRPYGTGADFVRLPFDIAAGLTKGDPTTAFRAISNRLSIPLSAAMHLLTNVDYKGQAIYGRDKYGNELSPLQSAGGIGSEALGLVGFPSFAKNAVDYATGRQGGEQALTQGFELPFRYQSPGNSKTQKFVGNISGSQGKALYNIKKQVAGEAPFSTNQQEAIRQGGEPVLQQILDIRKAKREAKVKPGEQATGDNIAYAAESSSKPIVWVDGTTVKTLDLSKEIKQPKLTGNAELDKKLISKYNGQLTSRANDIVSAFQAGKINQKTAETELEKLKSSKASATGKSSGGGKGRKAKAVKISSPKVGRVTFSKRIGGKKLPAIKLNHAPLKTKKMAHGTVKIAAPSPKVSYRISRPELKGLTNAIKIV